MLAELDHANRRVLDRRDRERVNTGSARSVVAGAVGMRPGPSSGEGARSLM